MAGCISGVGGAGPAGATGPAGPAGPAGSSLATSICGQWVNEPGVFGVATPFVLANWQDVSTVAPNTASASAVTATLVKGALRIIPTPSANAGALNVDISGIASGDDVCFRLAVQQQGVAIGTANTNRVFAGVWQAAGADVPWIGGGYTNANNAWGTASPYTVGRWAGANTPAGAALGGDTAAGLIGSLIFSAFDVRVRRVAAGVTIWMAFMGGPWMQVATNGATVNMASGTVRAGVRVQCNVGQTLAVSLLAFKHFVGGLPADLQQA